MFYFLCGYILHIAMYTSTSRFYIEFNWKKERKKKSKPYNINESELWMK